MYRITPLSSAVLFALFLLGAIHAQQVTQAEDIRVAKLKTAQPDSRKFGTGLTWTDAPAFLQEADIFEPNNQSGNKLTFEVLEDGVVLIAASWTVDGDNTGDWRQGRATTQSLLRDGWIAVHPGMLTMVNDKPDSHFLFRKTVKAGESYAIHTRQHGAPLLILPQSDRAAEILALPSVAELRSTGSVLWTRPFMASTASDLSTRDIGHEGARGSVLVGLRVTTDFASPRFGICSLQPIYENDDGRIRGPELGRPGATAIELEAKPGYAVGAIIGSNGKNISALQLIFMRRQKATVDPNDSYVSRWVGARQSSAEVKLGGNGQAIGGLEGKAGEAWQVLKVIPAAE